MRPMLTLRALFLGDCPRDQAESRDAESERDVDDSDSGIQKWLVVLHVSGIRLIDAMRSTIDT